MNIDDLAKEIQKQMSQYSLKIDDAMQKEITGLSEEIVKDLESDPIIPKDTGSYKKGFYAKKLASGKGYKKVLIANKVYQLTHLLEYGHNIFIGTTKGQTQIHKKGGRTKSFPHWETAQTKADTLVERLERIIKK